MAPMETLHSTAPARRERLCAKSSRGVMGARWTRDLGNLGRYQRIPYTDEDRETWALLFREHLRDVARLPIRGFREMYDALGVTTDRLPDLEELNRRFHAHTGWTLLEVDGMVENPDNFHLASRRLQPFTPLIRGKDERYAFYWPDIFHEFCHLPPLFDPDFAGFARRLGELGDAAYSGGDVPLQQKVSRIYWHLNEYGFTAGESGVESVGALLAGHVPELEHVLANPGLLATYESVDQIAGTPLPWEADPAFHYSQFQKRYFVVPDFARLRRDIERWSG
jgi:phenylalanine-4-hydroxylase